MPMCFGGGRSQQAPTTPPQVPGVVDVSKAAPDPSQAYKYRGDAVGDNTGRQGGGLLVEAADKAAAAKLKTTTGA